jgi:hypothetical protein
MTRNSATKTEKSATIEQKKEKVLSPKKQVEADHLLGKHNDHGETTCGFCQRRNAREIKKAEKTRRFNAAQKK